MESKINGFTLIEVVVVLSIWSVIILLLVPISLKQIEVQQEKRFFETFEIDILYMQRLSMMTKENVRLRFYDDSYHILKGQKEPTILVRDMPSSWKINMRNYLSISFDENGRMRNPITIVITTTYASYNIIFPLGKGRYYVVEQ